MAEFTIEREAPDAFRWKLMDGPALEIARSGRIFPTAEEARAAIDEVKASVADATVAPPPEVADTKVDVESEQSFPASDPPSTWASAGGS